MDDAMPAKPEPKGELFVVDGVNVCFWHKHFRTGKDLPSVRPLLLLLCEIREHGDDFYCVFDHTIKNHMTSDREAKLVEWLVRKYPNRFVRTAIDSRADPVILHYADKYRSRVISNDRYRDFFGQFGWLSEKMTPRLVQGNYHQSGLLTVEKLDYGYMELDSRAYTQQYVNRLVACLVPNYDWHKAADAANRAQAPALEPGKAVEKVGEELLAAEGVSRSQGSGHPKTSTAKATPAKANKPLVTKTANRPRKIQPKVPVKKAAASKGTISKKKKAPRVASKKAVKPKSKPVRRRRLPPRKVGFLERLFGHLL